jgi:hypothetical protein
VAGLRSSTRRSGATVERTPKRLHGAGSPAAPDDS